ncbi:ATP-binding protein [Bdellovibrionota bacterium FG-1]
MTVIDTVEISRLIGQPEDERLEYKAVLPPARTVGQLICAFANAKGGYLVLGVVESSGKLLVNGLSEDFRANEITQRAVDLLSPRPSVSFQYLEHSQKRLFVIFVEKSAGPVSIEGKVFVRQGAKTVLTNSNIREITPESYARLKAISARLSTFKAGCTGSGAKFIDHFRSVLNIVDDLGKVLYPVSPAQVTTDQEGKMLMRILFSSCTDNFETYLSDLLYEIYLAKPDTLKSAAQVTLKEVLDCSDMQEFVDFYAKKKLAKLQRGSVKGFITENPQIASLGVLTDAYQEGIEKLLQIRHLYSHRNGIVDERFLQHYPGLFTINQEHCMTLDDFLDKFEYLATVVDSVDKAALSKYSLASVG